MMKLSCRLAGLVLLVLGSIESVFGQIKSTSFVSNILQESKDANILISPLMLKDGLWHLYLAAEGKTLEELANILKVNHLTKEEVIQNLPHWRRHVVTTPADGLLFIGNRLYLGKDVNVFPTYKDQISKLFNTNITKLDAKHPEFAIPDSYEWIADQTAAIITEYPSRAEGNTTIDDQTKVLLFSAIYFELSFASPFAQSIRGPFQKSENTIEIDKVAQIGRFKYGYNEKVDADVLELPIEDSKISSFILLPRAVDGVNKVVQYFDSLNINNLIPQSPLTELVIFYPVFESITLVSLKNRLQRMGIHHLFKDPNLSAMTNWNAGKLLTDFMLVEMLELESRVNSTSAIPQRDFPNPNSLPVVDINHPFVYVVKDEHRVYFIGRVNSPEKKSHQALSV